MRRSGARTSSRINVPSLQINFPSLQINFPSHQIHFPLLEIKFPSSQINDPSLPISFPSPQTNLPSPLLQINFALFQIVGLSIGPYGGPRGGGGLLRARYPCRALIRGFGRRKWHKVHPRFDPLERTCGTCDASGIRKLRTEGVSQKRLVMSTQKRLVMSRLRAPHVCIVPRPHTLHVSSHSSPAQGYLAHKKPHSRTLQ